MSAALPERNRRTNANEQRPAKAMVRPLHPPRINDPLSPLPCDIQPRSRVELEVMSRSIPEPEKRRNHEQRNSQRCGQREQPLAKIFGGVHFVWAFGRRFHAVFMQS